MSSVQNPPGEYTTSWWHAGSGLKEQPTGVPGRRSKQAAISVLYSRLQKEGRPLCVCVCVCEYEMEAQQQLSYDVVVSKHE